MKQHSSLIGGSSAARLLQCPGSWRANLALPPSADVPSAYAEEGSFAHAIMERLMRKRMAEEPLIDLYGTVRGYVGEQIYDRIVTPAHIDELIDPALGMLEVLEEAYGGGFEVVGVEERVAFPDVLSAFGTVDLILRSASHIIVADYKFGQGVPVRAIYNDLDGDTVNAQLLYYLVAAMNSKRALFTGKRKLVIAVVQPRAENGLSHTEVSRKETKWFVEDVHEAVQTAMDRDPPLRKGEACRWCPAKVSCPEWTAPMLEIAALKPPADKNLGYEQLGLTPYGKYLSKAKTLVDQLALFSKEVNEQLHAYLEDGGQVPGWRLKDKVKNRQWIDDKTVASELTALGFGSDDIWQRKLATFAAADATAKRLGVVIPDHLRVAPPTTETTVCQTDDPAPPVERKVAIEEFASALKALT
jgi:CRISPR/Cas system-associated exonuclease Cas4 (RecB family)